MMSKFTTTRTANTIGHGWHLFRNRRTLWQMLREVLSGSYKMSFLTVLIVFIAIGYIIFPFDIIPDYIPVIGWIDDAVVFYLLIRRLTNETHRYNRFKAIERKGICNTQE
jgi:uncharacterized membrane protein YkvA (DUF1232 family)